MSAESDLDRTIRDYKREVLGWKVERQGVTVTGKSGISPTARAVIVGYLAGCIVGGAVGFLVAGWLL